MWDQNAGFSIRDGPQGVVIERPMLLMLDNHHSYLDLQITAAGNRNIIAMMSFTPNFSNFLETFDRTVDGPLESTLTKIRGQNEA